MSKKKYLIIGGSSGIGKALADRLSAEGHEVYASYHQKDMRSNAGDIHYFPLDVREENLAFDFLPESIDGMAYCPGSINLKPFSRLKAQQVVDDFQLQVVGAIKVIQAILPQLKQGDQASIVLFSTVAVQLGFNYHTQVATSKGAIEGLTRSLAAELAPGIRVNAIAPSLTNTPLASNLLNTESKKEANAERHPLQRIGEAEDIAAMAAFLLSNQASWISGQIMRVDGGMSSIKI